MNDYLNNIVARTMGIADVVQPRLTQLFEGSGHYQTESSDLSPETYAGQLTAQNFTDPTARQPSQPKTPITVSDFASPASSSTSLTPPAENPEGPVATLQTFETIPEKSRSNAAVDQVTTIAPRPQTQSASSPSELPRHSETQPQEVSNRSSSPPSRKTLSLRATRHPASRSAAASQHATAPVALPSSASDEHLEQSSTAIKITIGRVDVRAILPPAAPLRPAHIRPKPALSLESYLKEREQGKR